VSSDAARLREAQIEKLPFITVDSGGGFFQGSGRSIREIWGRRELLGLLVRREIRARYKDSSLGVVWSLLRPIAQLLIYYFVIGQVLGVARGVPQFAIFVFTGLTAWTLFTEILTNATSSIVNNSGLIKKVNLPREIFPLAAVGGGLFSLGIQFVVLLAGSLALGQIPISPNLLYLAPSLLLLVIYSSAFGILLSAANVYFRDFQHLIEVVLIVLFWASPIVYSYRYVHRYLGESFLAQVYLGNPVTIGVLGLQKAMWLAGSVSPAQNFPPDIAWRTLVMVLIGVVVLWVAQRVFARLQGNFAQEL
jgi:ABC-2 type transport system permease protein